MKQIKMLRLDDVLRITNEPDLRDVRERLQKRIEALPYHYAPNPEELDGRNIMGQSEPEFWDIVDAED